MASGNFLSRLWKKLAAETTLHSHRYEKEYKKYYNYAILRGRVVVSLVERYSTKATPVKGKEDLYSVVRHWDKMILSGENIDGKSFWSKDWPPVEVSRDKALEMIAQDEKEWEEKGFAKLSWRPWRGRLASEVVASTPAVIAPR